MRNVLLSAISHDFRTPLATIIGSASTLRGSAPGRLDDAQRATLLDTLLLEAQRMNRLIGNLLDLTRLSDGKVELKHDWIALDELIGAVLARLRDLLAQHPITLRIAENLPMVAGDEVMIEQVLSNLLENVARHTPAGIGAEISAYVADNMLEVAIRDHGPGLAPDEAARVFEKFHQTAPERAQSGFGLGLAICKAIIDAHGGAIGATNAPGGGAEFRFRLPLLAPAAPTP